MDFDNIKNKLEFNSRNSTSNSDEYRSHAELINESKRHPARLQIATASAFANWVYELAHPKSGIRSRSKSQSLLMGKEGEHRIESNRLWANHKSLPPPGVSRFPGWELWFADPLDGSAAAFTASKLCIKDKAMKCIPDVVLKEKSTGDILIIERKITKAEALPKAGWPNVKAQLWCYSYIDEFQSARNVYLVNQIWRFIHGEYILQDKTFPRWVKNVQSDFHKECAELFTIYGGKVY